MTRTKDGRIVFTDTELDAIARALRIAQEVYEQDARTHAAGGRPRTAQYFEIQAEEAANIHDAI